MHGIGDVVDVDHIEDALAVGVHPQIVSGNNGIRTDDEGVHQRGAWTPEGLNVGAFTLTGQMRQR